MAFAFQTIEKRLLLLFSLVVLITGSHLGWAFFQQHSVSRPDRGGTLDAGSWGTLVGANPVFAHANTPDADIARLLYAGLTKYDPVSERFVPDLADVERDESQKVYTFTLREGAQWHDGKAVTSDDVVFTYQSILQNPNIGIPGLLAAHKNNVIEKVNDRTVRITLKDPYAFFPTVTTFPILPRHIWESVPAKDIVSAPLSRFNTGSGSYRLDRLRSSEDGHSVTVSLEAFDRYHGDQALIEHLNLTFYKDQETLLSAMDGLDVVNNIPVRLMGKHRSAAFTTLSYALPQYVALFLNTSSPILDNRNVRLALSLATDRTNIIQSIVDVKRVDTPFLGEKSDHWIYRMDLTKANGALHTANWRYATPTPSPTSAPGIPPSVAVSPSSRLPSAPSARPSPEPTVTPQLSPPPSPTLLLFLSPTPVPTPTPTPTPVSTPSEQFPPTPWPVRVSALGLPLKLTLVTADTPLVYGAIAEQLKEQYREIGVELSIVVLDSERLGERIKTKQYDVLLYGQSLDYTLDTFSFWHSSQSGPGGLNLSNLTSRTVDRMLEQMRNPENAADDASVAAKRQEAVDRLVAVFDDQVPAIFLYQPLYYFHYRPNALHGMEIKNLRTFSDRVSFLMRAFVVEQQTLREPFSATTFMKWVLGREGMMNDE